MSDHKNMYLYLFFFIIKCWILSFFGLISYLLSIRFELKIIIMGVTVIPIYIPVNLLLLKIVYIDYIFNLEGTILVIILALMFAYTIVHFAIKTFNYVFE